MTTVTLDATHDTLDAVYTALQRDLGLSAQFGRNLDALWDALTADVPGPFEIVWRDHARALAKLGGDGERLIATLRDVERARGDFHLVLA